MLVVVMGMGRSGTSVLMQVLDAAGFDCGSDFIPGNENNPRGYYERKPVMHFNIGLLEQASGQSRRLYPLPTEEQIEPLTGTPVPIEFPAHDSAVKDPRFSLTFPVWWPHLHNHDVRVIIARRDEDAIAESMLRAYGINLSSAKEIIGEYNRRACLWVDRYGLNAAEIWYEDWFDDPAKNIAKLEALFERKLDVDLESLLDPSLRRCKGNVIENDSKTGQDSLPPLLQENLYGLKQQYPQVAETLEATLAVHTIEHSESAAGLELRITHTDHQEEYTFTIPAELPETHPSRARYATYNPQAHWLLAIGLDGFFASVLSEQKLSVYSPLVIIEPDLVRAIAYLSARSYTQCMKWPNLYWFVGEDAFEAASEALEGTLRPYFQAAQAACLVPSPGILEQRSRYESSIRTLQARFQQQSKQTQAEAYRARQRFQKSPDFTQEKPRVLIVTPRVSCWTLIGKGLAQGFETLGLDAQYFEVGFPPSTINPVESLGLLETLHQQIPHAIITLSHPSDMLIRGIVNQPIPRLIWFVDHPDHLLQTPHGEQDWLMPVWQEFKEPLKKRQRPVTEEIVIGAFDRFPQVQAKDEFHCDVAFVGSIIDTSSVRNRIPQALLKEVDEWVSSKINEPQTSIETILERSNVDERGLARLTGAIESEFRRPGMNDRQMLIFFLHVESIRRRRGDVIRALGEFDLRVYGSPDWQAILAGSPAQSAFQGHGLGPDDYLSLCASAKINLNINPCFPHSGPTVREMDTPLAGGFLLSDLGLYAGSRLAEFFEPGREIALFETAEDAAAQVRYFLDHPEERKAIVQAAQARIQRDHTYSQRAQQFVNLLQQVRSPAAS